MAINRHPKGRFAQIANDYINEVPANMIGIILLFLSRPPGWRMKFEELKEHWNESDRSLRRALRCFRELGHINIKSHYDTKKKKFAGSYYYLVETSEGNNQQSHTKSRVSAKSEALQNDGLKLNTELTNNNTNCKYIDSNTIGGGYEFSDNDIIYDTYKPDLHEEEYPLLNPDYNAFSLAADRARDNTTYPYLNMKYKK